MRFDPGDIPGSCVRSVDLKGFVVFGRRVPSFTAPILGHFNLHFGSFLSLQMLDILFLVSTDKKNFGLQFVCEFEHFRFWDRHLQLLIIVHHLIGRLLLGVILKLFTAANHSTTLIASIFLIKLLHFMHLVFLGQKNVGAFVVHAAHVETSLILPLILINILPS